MEEQRTSFENSAMRRPITALRATTTLLSRVYKQASKCHIKPKYGDILSFVCKDAWGCKMIILRTIPSIEEIPRSASRVCILMDVFRRYCGKGLSEIRQSNSQ